MIWLAAAVLLVLLGLYAAGVSAAASLPDIRHRLN
jgi:hypothetical protein